MFKFSTLFVLSTALLMRAGFACDMSSCCCEDACSNWHAIVGAGYAFSNETDIHHGDDFELTNEGYRQDLGNVPFFTIGVGHTVCQWLDIDASYSYYQTFHYQKYQTPSPLTPPTRISNVLLNQTRYFDLDHQNVMFDFTIDPASCFSCDCCCFKIRPIVGAGIGVGINHISNFRTVGFDRFAEVGSEALSEPTTSNCSFAWRVLAAIRFSNCYCEALSFDLGYRYYDGGEFKSSHKSVVNVTGIPGSVIDVSAWEGRLRTNEVYGSFNWAF